MALYANLHCHDGNGSVNDGVATPEQNVQRLVDMGAQAVCMTNHGTMVSTWDYIKACSEQRDKKTKEVTRKAIKFIPGIEFYVEMPGTETRRHLIALAKSFKGYQAICKVVSETAFHNVDGYPIVTDDMLERWFGPDAPGHGEAFFTTACMQGVIAAYILQNDKIKREEEKIRRKQKERPNIEEYNGYVLAIKQNDAETAIRRLERDKNKLKSGDKEIFEAAVKRLDELKAENKKLRALRDKLKPSVERYERYEGQIKELHKSLVSDVKAKKMAIAEAEKYLKLFGEGNFFMEMQYHGLEAEAHCMPIMADIAKKLGIPVVAANDSHMVNKEDAEMRQVMFAQKYSWKEIEGPDRELYIKSDEELSEWLRKILPTKVVEEAINNIKVIVDQCNVEFSAGTHYPKFPCKEGAKLHLRKLIAEGKKKVQPWTDEYQARLEHELKVIETMGFSDYLCIVEDFINYGKLVGKCDLNSPEFLEHRLDIEYLKKLTENEVGEGMGPGRGSAAGSLICYLIGITNIEPVKNALLFERFLNPERVTMPDIDSDVAPEVRPFVIEYIKNKYGEKAVCQILTRGFFGAKSAINAGARVLAKKRKAKDKANDDETQIDAAAWDVLPAEDASSEEKALVKLSYSITDTIEDANASIADVEADILAKFSSNPDVPEILAYAKLIEGKCQNYGTHAAGIVISDNSDVSDYLPLIKVTDAIDCSCDLNYVEPLGMLKLDLLGLRNLGIITECEKAILKETGERISMDNLPEDPDVFKEIFSTGRTNGVFQFESDGMKKTLVNFGPDSISDLTLLNAIFRPGPLQYIDDVTAVKKGKKKAEYIIPEMGEILDVTYGKPIYQEQLMAIFNRFAGFSLGKADIIRRHMAKKHVDEFNAYKQEFIDGLVANGAEASKAEAFWQEITAFAEYAFNKSHSRAYSEVAYATAYLKHHYPEAYTVGLLNYTAPDKREAVLSEAVNNGISICSPDINLAEENFVLRGKDVIYGLSSVSMVAASARTIVEERKANGSFTSFLDFCQRVRLRKNVMENLIKAGAFDRFHKNRQTLLAIYPDIINWIDTVAVKSEKLATETSEKKRETLQRALETAQNNLMNLSYQDCFEDATKRLVAEKDVLGRFISNHPVRGLTAKWVKKIKDIDTSDEEKDIRATVLVFVNGVEKKKSKNGNSYLKITAEDETGSIVAMAFDNAINKELLVENTVVTINGTFKGDTMMINKVEKYVDTADIQLEVSSYQAFLDNKERFEPYKGDHRLVIYCKNTGKPYKTKIFVNKDVKELNI